MIITTYKDLVAYLKVKTKEQKIEEEPISIFVRDLQTKQSDTIINKTNKTYNWAFLVYDPQYSDPMGWNLDYSGGRSQYLFHTIEEGKQIGEFLIQNTKAWVTNIHPDDVLEQQ